MPKFIDQDTGDEFPLYPTPEWAAEHTRLNQVECRHENTEVRRFTFNNGASHFGRQCLCCGIVVGPWIGKGKVPADVAPADKALQTTYEEERERQRQEINQRHIRLQRQHGNIFAKLHRDYLATKEWAQKRGKVLTRSNGRCEGCLDAEATVVHHLEYKRWGDELLFDLVALCRPCHAKCHPEKQENDKQEEPHCYACRYLAWTDDDRLWCAKFEISALEALSTGGQCGPLGHELEPLK